MSETETEIIGEKSADIWKRNELGRFAPGGPPGPGRPQGRRDFICEFIDSLEEVEKEEGIKFLKAAWKKAYRKTDVMRDMMDRIVPKKSDENTRPTAINVVINYR